MIPRPAALIATEEPRKKEPPIMVPRAIIVKRPAVRPFALFFIGFLPFAFCIIIPGIIKYIQAVR